MADRVPYERRGSVLDLVEFGWLLSFIIAVPLAGFLIARFGWQALFPWLAILGLMAFAVLLLMLPKDTKRDIHQSGMMKLLPCHYHLSTNSCSDLARDDD